MSKTTVYIDPIVHQMAGIFVADLVEGKQLQLTREEVGRLVLRAARAMQQAVEQELAAIEKEFVGPPRLDNTASGQVGRLEPGPGFGVNVGK